MPCVNKSLNGFKELASQLGESLAESIVVANKYEIPTLEQAVQMIRGNNVLQYKKAVRHLQSITSSDAADLASGLNRVIQQYGGNYYVVKGARLSESPAPITAVEVEGKNVEFLQALNAEFGQIFTVAPQYENPAAKNLHDEIVNDIQALEETKGAFSSVKDLIVDSKTQAETFQSLAEQALDRNNLAPMAAGLSEDIVDKIGAYNESLNNRKITAGQQLFSKPNPDTAVVSEQYKFDNGIETPTGENIYSIDSSYSKQIADAYENMEHNPNDPVVKAAYEAMAQETMKQFDSIKKGGYAVEIYTGEGEPYANSQAMIADVTYNKHLFVLSTEKEYGEKKISAKQREENPLLRDSGQKDVNGTPLLVNDVFRYVHDFFGHSERGNGFGPVGEENAWDTHARMYTDEARRAMTTETRGQNSWVNFGPHMRNEEGKILRKGEPGYLEATARPFAEQKIGLLDEKYSQLPEELGTERGGLRIADGTYHVDINQDALGQLAEKNRTAPKEEYFQKVQENSTVYNTDPVYWSEDQKRAFSLSNTTRMLQSKFGIQFSFINDPNGDYRAKYSQGKVVINEAKVYPDTPFHEIVHPFLLTMKNQEGELYNSLKQDLLNSEDGKATLEQVKKNYPELNPDEQIDEAIAEHVGKLSGERNLESKPWYQKFIDWLRTTLANMGIMVKGFETNMSLSSFADLILDPSFVFDFEKATDIQNEGEFYQKATAQTETNFNNTMDEVLRKLRADTNIPSKTEEESSRKFFSGQQLKALEANRKDIKALDSFVLSALSQTKKVTESFEAFREIYEQKGKKSPADIKKMTQLLYQMENTVVLYSDLRPLVRSMKELFPDEEDSWGSLTKYLDRQDQLIDGYKKYGIDAVSEWLMPYMKKAINQAKATGKINSIVSKETMAKVSNILKAKGVTDPDVILHEAVKQEIQDTLRVAKDETGFFSNWFSGVLNEKDSIAQLVGLALSDEIQKGLKNALHVKEKIIKALKQYRGNVKFASEKDEEEFYKKYLRQAKSYEYAGLDKDGKEKYEHVNRWAFHEEYLWDEFYNAKREFQDKLGERPPRESKEFAPWEAKRKAWFAANTIAVTDKNSKVSYVPAAKYKNGQFTSMMNDPYYKVLYENYKTANDKLGNMGLKYGMVPQVSKGRNLFTGITKVKNVKESLKKTATNLREGIGAQEQIYYAENIEGLERKTIPINHVRLLDEEDLSFNLADGVSKLVTSASKYEAMKSVEPHVMVLKNFINGNAYLKVDKRQALQNSAKGFAKLKKGAKTVMPVEAVRLNDMLNGFINDVVYGEGDEKQLVQLWGSRFVVHEKNDVSNNGKPMKQVVKNFEDLRQLVGKPDLNYTDFKVNEPLELNGHVVTLTNKDWNLSLNKVGNFAGVATALQSMALNVNSLVMNVGVGNVQNFIEASGGKHFTLRDWAASQKEYWAGVFSGKFLEDTRGGKQSEISQLLSHYDALQGEFEDELGRKISAGVANRLMRRDKCFFFQKVGEHQIQSTGLLAAMRGQKVQTNAGETINLRQAWVKDQDGNLQLRKDIKWSEEDDRGFQQKNASINRELNGNFSKIDKAKIQRIWYGRALIMFRKHIYNAFKARYGKEQVNYERGGVTEGYYRAFGKAALDQLSTYMLNHKFRPLTDAEKYAMRKVSADLGVIVAMMVLFKATDDDDDDNGFNDEVAFWSRRMLSDTAQYAPVVGWLELWKMVKDPSASAGTLGKYYDALSQFIVDPSERYEKSGPGYTEGELKWKVKMSKVIPLYRQWVNLQNPEDLLKYYKLNVKSVFNSKSKNQEEKQQAAEEKQQELENQYGNQ